MELRAYVFLPSLSSLQSHHSPRFLTAGPSEMGPEASFNPGRGGKRGGTPASPLKSRGLTMSPTSHTCF